MYGKLMNESLKAIIDNRNALFKALFIPALVLLCMDIVSPKMLFVFENGKPVLDKNNQHIFGVIAIISFYINIVIAVSVHRIILIKDNIPLLRGILPSSIELNFFLKILLFSILTIITAFLISAFSTALLIFFVDKNIAIILASILAIMVIFVFASRFSMVFPAIAINQKMSFSEALKMTKNYKFLSLFMVTIFPTIIAILTALAYGLVIGFLTGVVSSHFSILYVFLSLFINVLVISCLSVTYSYIKEENDKKIVEDETIN